MNYHEVTAVAPHFSTKGRTIETRKTIAMLIIPWLETSKEMCHWYPKLKKKRLILLTKASLRTRKRLSTPQLSQFLCSMKLYLAAFHITQNGEKTCTTSDLMKENAVWGRKKTKLGKSQKHVEKNLFKCPAGPEQCQLVIRDIPGHSAEEEGIHRFRKFD